MADIIQFGRFVGGTPIEWVKAKSGSYEATRHGVLGTVLHLISVRYFYDISYADFLNMLEKNEDFLKYMNASSLKTNFNLAEQEQLVNANLNPKKSIFFNTALLRPAYASEIRGNDNLNFDSVTGETIMEVIGRSRRAFSFADKTHESNRYWYNDGKLLTYDRTPDELPARVGFRPAIRIFVPKEK